MSVPTQAELARALAEHAGVRVAVLFGSVPEGRAQDASDVDVAVIAPGVDLLALARDLGARLGREVDLVDLTHATIPLLEELVAHGVVVHEAEPGAGAIWRSRALATLETDRPWFARMREAFLDRWRHEGASRGPA